jgi:hypothetical protein
MRRPAAASQFVRLCAGRITRTDIPLIALENAEIPSLTFNAFLMLSDVTEW